MKKVLVVFLIIQVMNATQPTQNLHRYMLANYYQFAGDLKNAGHWYSQIAPDKSSWHIYTGYIPFLAANNSFVEIVTLIPQLDEHFKNNQEIQFFFATALEKIGRKQEAHQRLAALNEQFKSNQTLAFETVKMYLERGEPENALKVIDNLLNNGPRRTNNYIFYFMRSQILLQLNKKADALIALQHCIEMYPKFDKSWLLYAAIQEQEGKIEEAIKGYSTFLETTTEPHADIERHLLGLAFRQKLMQNQTLRLGQDTAAICLAQAIQSFEKKEYAHALVSVDKCLAQAPKDPQARLMKIQILANRDQFDHATQLLAEWMIHDDLALWLKTLHLLCYLGLPYKKALEALELVEKKKGSSVQLALYKADLALRDTDQAYALKALQNLNTLTLDAPTKSQIALQIAIIYYDQHNSTAAQKTLEDALVLPAVYPPVYNLLAYIYASDERKRSSALSLIEKALEKDADNPHFLDTKAYILYQQKQYDQALPILQKVAAVCPTDYSILNHLGQCYFQVGKKPQAIKTMHAAQTVAKTAAEQTDAKMFINQWDQ